MSVEIQDNEREKQLIKLFKLHQPKNRSRIDVDAYLRVGGRDIPFEIKSTTVGDIATARDVGLPHIRKWKKMHWLVGIYDKEAILQHVVYGSPEDMAGWLDFIETDIKRGLKISKMIVERIDMKMVIEVFGDKTVYSYADAKFVFKRLFTRKEYLRRQDKKEGYSKLAMLKMFKEHNWHYLERGSSLNNPKIPKKEYRHWLKIITNHSKELRVAVEEYLNDTK